MKLSVTKNRRRGTILLMIVGLLAMLFVVVSAYIVLARFDRQALGFVRQGSQVTQILGSIHDVLAAEIRGPRTTPGASVTGAAYVDTPAYYDGTPGLPTTTVRGAPWLASPEPVRDVTVGTGWPEDYAYPVVTGASGKVSGRRRLTGLMWNAHDANPNEGVYVRPAAVPTAGNLTPDTIANARDLFTDATGDGIPDSYFGSVSVLTELANALVGQSLRASIRPDEVDWYQATPNENTLAWLQFSELARYAVAARVISHGGMVQVSAPTDQQMWNSQFLAGMFNWIRHPNDGAGQPTYAEMSQIWAERGTVEPFLRRRGGLLAGYGAGVAEGVPKALWNVQNRFRRTFQPYYDLKADNWQRFNLASLSEWNAWRQAVTIDPVAYNIWYNHGGGMGGPDPRPRYVPRQLLTTVNNSDELAREQSKDFSPKYWQGAATSPGIEPGSLKYYLGKIRHAFDTNGEFVSSATNNDYDGYEVIRDLTSYFCEMLAGHKDFPDLTDPNATPPYPDSTRRQQAFALAVNTVAFAAPRDRFGHVDAVYGADFAGNLYIGYAPQPFITQVVAYNKPTNPPNSQPQVALAVELYNPHDSVSGSTVHPGLELRRFGVSINNNFDPSNPSTGTFGPLSALGQYFPGREFRWFPVHAGNNAFFDAHSAFPAFNLSVPYPMDGAPIRVKLWRQNIAGNLWYVVDELEIETKEGPLGLPADEEWYVNVRRDTSWEPYLGRWQPTGAPARWRMAVGFQPDDDAEYKTLHTAVRGSSPDPNIVLPPYQLGTGIDDPFSTGVWADRSASELSAIGGHPLGPAVPLHTMNGGANPAWVLHGAARPVSFPTVGFMLFVPRACHIVKANGTRLPITETLRNLWKQGGYGFGTGLPPPADFGHMPIFDNTQPEHDTVGGFNKTGRIPWGLLVFDYFTTLDPAIDAYRVSGRININAAPWYVLAGLPLLGPVGPNLTGNLPLWTSADPAFWSADAGVLVGEGADDITNRYPGAMLNRWSISGGQWYRLGPYLAQAAAAYRDRVSYSVNSANDPFLAEAPFRGSDVVDPRYLERVYRPLRYGDPTETIRGGKDYTQVASDAMWKRGLLSIGELANVMGFDSWAWDGVALPRQNTVLGPYFDGVSSYELGGDFMKAVSLLALLDTHFLTTRSNTFTVYLTLTDRQDPQASVRSQVTIDRSNLLPRLLAYDSTGNGIPDTFITQEDSGLPETVGQREVSYFNARHDE